MRQWILGLMVVVVFSACEPRRRPGPQGKTEEAGGKAVVKNLEKKTPLEEPGKKTPGKIDVAAEAPKVDKTKEAKAGVEAALAELKALDVDVRASSFGPEITVGLRGQIQEDGTLKPAVAKALAKLPGVTTVEAYDTPLSDLTFLTPHTKIEVLGLYNTPLTDESLAPLEKLENLKKLELRRNLGLDPEGNIGDKGLQYLKGLKRLYRLDANAGKVTDKGLVFLKDLVAMEQLNLADNQIRGSGLGNLQMMAKLESLDLSRNKISGPQLAEIKKLTSLPKVDLSSNGIEDEDLEFLRGATFVHLTLDGNPISSRGIKTLAELPKLKVLSVGDTELDDAGLEELLKFPELTGLSIHGTKVTEKGFKTLAKLPKLTSIECFRIPITDAAIESLLESKTLASIWMSRTKLSDETRK